MEPCKNDKKILINIYPEEKKEFFFIISIAYTLG